MDISISESCLLGSGLLEGSSVEGGRVELAEASKLLSGAPSFFGAEALAKLGELGAEGIVSKLLSIELSKGKPLAATADLSKALAHPDGPRALDLMISDLGGVRESLVCELSGSDPRQLKSSSLFRACARINVISP